MCLQEWISTPASALVIVFEGRDAAGKGGVIRALTERVSPRVFRVVALPAPSDREKSQLYIQRYLPALSRRRARSCFRPQLVQPRRRRVCDGLLLEAAAREFPEALPRRSNSTSSTAGIILSNTGWRSATMSRSGGSRRASKTLCGNGSSSPMDFPSRERWFDYSRARDLMLEATDSEHAPWHIVRSDDKRRARLNIISHLSEPVPL